MRRALGILLLLGVCVSSPRAQQPAEAAPTLAEAVAVYDAGRYDEALARFSALAADEPDGARRALLHANAGTAAARAERFGEAVWHLLEALRLSPRDEVASTNLAQVQVRLGGVHEDSQDLAESLARLPLRLTWREAHLGGNALLALALVLLAVRRGGVGGRRFTGAIAACLLLALGWWAADHLARTADLQRTVVLASSSVRGEPSEVGKVLFRLEPGTVVRSEDRRGDWRLVETGAGGRGWLPAEAVRGAGG